MKTSSSPITNSLLKAYKALLANGDYEADAAHVRVINRLQHLLLALEADTPTPPMGLYIHGPVGRGKSWLMGLFFDHCTLPKRRVHFHAFMQELHTRMHATTTKQGQDLMQVVAAQIASDCTVLCFDEFYITNIADAMLLGRLMEALFRQGVVVVATSNWGMDDLFQGGVNRDRFIPFIRTLQRYLEPVEIGEGRDYRLNGLALPALYVVGDTEAAAPQLEALFEQFASGRKMTMPPDLRPKRHVGRAAWFTFESLCETNLGREHYLELVRVCDTVVLEGVPILTPADANVAIRLMTLVDILYEHKRRLVLGAADAPERLCPSGDAAVAFVRTVSRLRQLTQGVWAERDAQQKKAKKEPLPKGAPKPHTRKSKASNHRPRTRRAV